MPHTVDFNVSFLVYRGGVYIENAMCILMQKRETGLQLNARCRVIERKGRLVTFTDERAGRCRQGNKVCKWHLMVLMTGRVTKGFGLAPSTFRPVRIIVSRDFKR